MFAFFSLVAAGKKERKFLIEIEKKNWKQAVAADDFFGKFWIKIYWSSSNVSSTKILSHRFSFIKPQHQEYFTITTANDDDDKKIKVDCDFYSHTQQCVVP